MRSTVVFLPTARADLAKYFMEMSAKSPSLDLTAQRNMLVTELKRLLAQTGGQPPGAYKVYENTYELEFLSGRVWVRYYLEREGRHRARITVLGWNRFPARR